VSELRPRISDAGFLAVGAVLFGAAVAVLAAVGVSGELRVLNPVLASAFVVFALFTIFCGFPHPHFGHVSFDRVAQFSAVLIFGPVAAAAINMLASLIYPWHRLRQGRTVLQVAGSCLSNAGMMGLVILGGGLAYERLGGPVPLQTLNAAMMWPLLAMAVTAHLLNELFMAGIAWLKGGSLRALHNRFAFGVEAFSFLVAFLTALVINHADAPAIALYLLVLSVGMIAVRRLALLQQSLEDQVLQRTQELHEKTIELDRLVKEDPLTGLHNRRFMDERLAEEIRRALRYDRPLSVAIADLDHFKEVNDRFSHGIGDTVLAWIADALVARCRRTDLISRYGGEEFVLCFPETDEATAAELCDGIRAAIEGTTWDQVQPGLAVTISFGVVGVRGEDATIESVMAEADRRLYRAKHAGRNRVVSAAA
jgi:diguanylate cyclase (GGDEF)-like protein